VKNKLYDFLKNPWHYKMWAFRNATSY